MLWWWIFDGRGGAGAQVDGRTYIKYVRNNKTPDANKAVDVCLSEDQNYHAIYAFGQLTASPTHVPESSLEVLPAEAISNKDFYKEDVLKFHGGGIGTTYEGRGTLSPAVDLFEDPSASGPCTPSTEEGFTCSLSRLGGQVIIHYTPFADGGMRLPPPAPAPPVRDCASAGMRQA